MKTPDEIKRRLASAIPFHLHPGDPEPRLTPRKLLELEELMADALALIEQHEVQAPRWISVKERMPEDQRNVLTVNGHGYIRIMGFWGRRGARWIWLHLGRLMNYNDITHWMPLPEPPEEKN